MNLASLSGELSPEVTERFLALMFCTKKSEKIGIPDEIGCESTALWAKSLTHIGRTCKINQ